LDDFVGPNSLKTIFLNQENSVQLEMLARSLAWLPPNARFFSCEISPNLCENKKIKREFFVAVLVPFSQKELQNFQNKIHHSWSPTLILV
jgi:hypothetical protein